MHLMKDFGSGTKHPAVYLSLWVKLSRSLSEGRVHGLDGLGEDFGFRETGFELGKLSPH
jgi:hypothetical protein